MKKIPMGNVSALQYFRLMRYAVMILIGIVFTNSKGVVSLSEIGVYEAFMLIAGAACFFWINGLIQSFLPLFKKNKSLLNTDEQSKSPAFFNLFVLILIFNIVAILILYLFRESISGETSLKFFIFLAVYIFLINPSYLVENIYLLKNKPKQIVIYGTVIFLLQFLAVAGPVLLGYGLYYSFAGLIIVTAIRFVWLIYLLFVYSEFNLSIPFIKENLKLGTPLIISALLSGSAQYFDAFLIKETYGKSYLAVFQYGARELPLALILASAFSNAMLPVFSEGKDLDSILLQIKNKSVKLMHFLFPVSILLIIISNPVFPVIYNQDFAFSAKIFNIYLLLVISRMVFPQTVLIGLQKTKAILWGSLIEITVNVILSIILLSLMGMIGVAVATFIAYLLEKFVLILFLEKKNIGFRKYIPLNLLLFYSFMIILTFFIFDYMIFTGF